MDIFVRLILIILNFTHYTYNFMKSLMCPGRLKKFVPPSDDPILKLSATILAQKIRERKIYSQEIVQAYKNRILEVNPIINAVVEDRFEEALEEAKQVDKYLDENPDKIEELKTTKPFFGIPITIKEAIAVSGMSHTGRSLTRKNIKAKKDSIVVQLLKEAGLIPLLVSNTPEYCTSLETYNKLSGYTYNPYNTLYTSGGSSGGECALLGAGASLLGVGSDIVGSIRVPAIWNGVFGHKPSKKVVSSEGHFPTDADDMFQSCLVIGPLVRYAEDLKPLLKIMTGTKLQKLNLGEEVNLSNIKIFYMEDTGSNLGLLKVEKEIKAAVNIAAAYLQKECHCHISNRKFEELSESAEMAAIVMMGKLKTLPSPLHDTNDALGDNGVFLYPCSPIGPFKLGGHLATYLIAPYTAIANLLGLPATAVPTGFNANKLPIGIQIYSQEIIQAYKRRIQEVNPIINAVVEDRFAEALVEAKKIDKYLDENPDKTEEIKSTKPFFGIPITIKESIAVKGMSYTGASLTRKNIKADKDSIVVRRLKEAGLIPLLVSNTPEYCSCIETYNKIIGYTYNPYNTLYTAGGSSGGEGALLGASASLIGVGSDICGSIRVPAIFNGVFGHKTKIVPLDGHWPMLDDDLYRNYLIIGPMARYAEDLKPLLKIMSGPNAHTLNLDEEVDFRKIKIYYMEDTGNDFCLPNVQKEIKTAVKAATAYLSRECHCHVSTRKFKEFSESLEISGVNMMDIDPFPSPLNDTSEKYSVVIETIKALFGKSKFTFQLLWFSLLSALSKRFPGDKQKYRDKLQKLREVLLATYLALPNLLGLPATAVPTGFDANKLPVGIQIYSQEIVQSYKNRIQEVNPIINAVIEDRFEEALEEAKQLDRFLDENPDKINEIKNSKPFYGIPITIKESLAVKGKLDLEKVLNIKKGVKADKDSVVVQRLKEAGLIPLLVSSTPEYYGSLETYNKLIGYTYNPYNTLYTCGGSSGGEGALLASAASVIGIGSDIGGSIRIPAAFNGVFGHKPSSKTASLEGHWPIEHDDTYQNYLTIGPMTRYAEDLAPLLKIISGANAQKLKLDEQVDLSKIQIFYMEDTGNDFGLPKVEKEIKNSIKVAASYLSRECHCHVSKTKFKELSESLEISSIHIMGLKNIPSPLYDTDDALGDNGVLIYPCTQNSAFKLGGYFIGFATAAYLALPNILGLPATAVPTGFDAKKMPIGIQISSEEVVLAYIKRIKEVNPIINAVVEDRFTEALAEAKKVDEYLNRYNAANLDLENVKPLLGVPITVKESIAVKGMSFTGCSLTRKGVKAKEDAEAVTLLKEAGAIILLVSSTPEYCAAIETYNNVIGRSKNPYDTRCGCGGSSGGEGALIGSGASVLGLGSDIAGSIRIPCAFNGIYGHKPTSGIVPLIGNLPWCDDERFCEYLAVGPMARYVEDLKLTMKVLAGNKASRLRLDDKSTLGPNGILLYPNFPTEPFRHNGFIKGMLGTRFALICNLLGCPSTCVPIGLNKKGLPLGIQVIGTPYQDNLTIEVAKELGKYFGGWQAPN
ncbi:fatty-acid amide hydrolase [Holotrichia oblita]|uniref:Fatty-acid amide hydrolase n=1 Tax=Holotrichia oblita TaxID=644536 RepID=A0ACB9SUV6_HOLOL|nr:fatty-acid amide hydrolase [Holotrichia oblita]